MIFIKEVFKILVSIFIILNFTSCSIINNAGDLKEKNVYKDTVKEEKNIVIPGAKQIVETLCSDSFEGRLVGSNGDEKTEKYIFEILKDLKLESIFEGEYYEPFTEEVYKKFGLIDDSDKPEIKEIHNLIGVIKGSDSTKAVVISAHFDHIGYQDGKTIRGALDNASGVATLVQIADILNKESKNKTFKQDIVFAFFDSEEEAQQGSKAFVKDIKSKYLNLYNINIDCVGGKKAGNISLNNKSKISNKLTAEMKKTFKNEHMDFSNVELAKGETSDHKSFEQNGIPNIFISQDNLKPYVHNENDTPDTLNYNEIQNVANVLSKFVEINDGKIFND